MPDTGSTPPTGFLRDATAYIRNPLGIIGLFVGLIYGVAVIVAGLSPQLSVEQRWAMTAFAVTFPWAILAAFFRLVTNHHLKLYAPADWKDERNAFGPQTAADRIAREERELRLLDTPTEQLQLPTSSIQSESDPASVADAPPPTLPPPPKSARVLANEGESLAFRWVETLFPPHEQIFRNVYIEGPHSGVTFDGLVSRPVGRHMVAIEIKVIRSPAAIPALVSDFGEISERALANIRSVPNPGTIAFMLVIVTIDLDDLTRFFVESSVNHSLRAMSLDVDVRVVDFEHLRGLAPQQSERESVNRA